MRRTPSKFSRIDWKYISNHQSHQSEPIFVFDVQCVLCTLISGFRNELRNSHMAGSSECFGKVNRRSLISLIDDMKWISDCKTLSIRICAKLKLLQMGSGMRKETSAYLKCTKQCELCTVFPLRIRTEQKNCQKRLIWGHKLISVHSLRCGVFKWLKWRQTRERVARKAFIWLRIEQTCRDCECVLCVWVLSDGVAWQLTTMRWNEFSWMRARQCESILQMVLLFHTIWKSQRDECNAFL